jgi:hypothetical protein
MPSDVTVTPRLICLEDVSVTTNPSGETVAMNVLGAAGNPQTLNKLALMLLTSLTQAANDAAAATAGVALGELYYCTGDSKPHSRLT